MEWMELNELPSAQVLKEMTARPEETFAGVDEAVAEIIEQVRKDGDKALKAYTARFDGCRLDSLQVTEAEFAEANALVGREFIEILEDAAQNIRIYHEEQKQESWLKPFGEGIRLGTLIKPIRRVGVYVPGGKAAYPSTVLMDVVPAQVAGVPSIAMVTPPDKEGKINPYILAAASVLGISEVYKIGGAQAVAALAYGTESIEPVFKIVGPGNAFVASAKKQVFGKVGIDMIAGPSEVGIVMDETAHPAWVAADLLAQAEHDPRAAVYLVATTKEGAAKVVEEVEQQIAKAPRGAIMRQSVEAWMKVFIVKNLDDAMSVMNGLAPEHLELAIAEPEIYLAKVEHAGAVFLGHYTPEPIGDYWAGPNHTLPTSGTAAFSSPLGVYDFITRSSILEYNRDALLAAAAKVEAFAAAEGLYGHARSVQIRREAEK